MTNWALGLTGFEGVIPAPDEFTPSPERIERRRRTASGKLHVDIIKTYRVFTLTYNVLSGAEYLLFYDEWVRERFLSFWYWERGAWRNATVWVSNFQAQEVSVNPEFWGPVTVVLEEQ